MDWILLRTDWPNFAMLVVLAVLPLVLALRVLAA